MELRRAVVDGVRIQMISGTHVLLLRDAEEARYLPIPIGPNEASAIAYIQIRLADGSTRWGAGVDTHIELASVKAVLSALNRALD